MAVLSVVAFWGGMYLVNVGMRPPAEILIGWIDASFGPYGILVWMVATIGLLSVGKRLFDRRDERRRYAQDRTIHVEKRKPIPWWGWAYFVVMGSMMTIGIIGAFSERAHEPMPGSDSPPGPSSR